MAPNTDAGSGKGAAKGLTVITNPGSAFDNINLSFLPLRKNFLGEGRYAQVYLGQYTVSNPAFSGGTGTGAATARPAPTTGRVAELRQALDPMVVDSPSSAPTPMEVDPILKASLSLAGDRLKHGAESTSGSMSDSTITPMTATPKNTSTSTPPPSSASEVSITPTQSTSTSTSTRASPFLTCAVKRMQNTPEAQSVGLAELFILRRLGNHPNVVRLIGAKDETDVDSFAVRNKIRRASLSSSSPVSSSPTGTAPLPNTLLGLDSSPRLLILLEYAPGGTMWDYIENSRDLGIGQEMWTRWAGQLAAAVEYIHSFGIVHHDIKPHNCLASLP
ncbi:hypothetical protein HK101_006305 [Irineochytrium annulatum]|nr:hypothetical protein HK101_006305 [Irineochytrium annulatum]